MKVALVHDYLREFGGAERVLDALAELWPEAPIYTAFVCRETAVGRHFAGHRIIESRLAPLLKHGSLYSPLRFLTPYLWRHFDLHDYDLVISSASWYVTRGFRVGPKTTVVCYCHTPPRWLYGYQTALNWRRFWPVRLYGQLVAHRIRFFDYQTAQEVDFFLANSENVRARIKKFYRREAKVIYPPVDVEGIIRDAGKATPQDYYLVVSRVVGSKGIEVALEAARRGEFRLKIVGEGKDLKKLARKWSVLDKKVEFLGRLSDRELAQAYARCRAFLALAEDEDFGITPVEAMAAGRPVIAYRGGGYLETVVAGKTGVFFAPRTPAGLLTAIGEFEKKGPERFNPAACRARAREFSRERFNQEMMTFIHREVGRKNA